MNCTRLISPDAHWVAIYQTPKTLYIYDSYGRLTKNVLKIISKTTTKKIVDSKHDPEQYGHTNICGHLAISWLCVVHDLGIRKYEKKTNHFFLKKKQITFFCLYNRGRLYSNGYNFFWLPTLSR